MIIRVFQQPHLMTVNVPGTQTLIVPPSSGREFSSLDVGCFQTDSARSVPSRRGLGTPSGVLVIRLIANPPGPCWVPGPLPEH